MTSSYMTIQAFSIEIQISVDNLIQQFLDMGITKTKFDFVTQIEKEMLLKHLNCNNIAVFNKFSLQRKTRSTLNISSVSGKSKKIQVEVRKKKVYMVQCPAQDVDLNTAVSLLNRDSDDSNCKISSNDNKKNTLIKKTDLISLDNNDTGFVKSIEDRSQRSNVDNNSVMNIKNSLELKVCSKICKETQKIVKLDLKQKLDKKIDVYYSSHENLSETYINKTNIDNNVNKLNDFSILTDHKSSSFKLEKDRRSINVRTRLKHRNLGKIIKQKKYNNSYSDMDIDPSLYKEGKLSISSSSYRVNKNKSKSALIQSFNKPVSALPRNVVIGDKISVLELSSKMSVKSSYMIKVMMKLGLMVTINQVLDQETAQLVVEELGHNAVLYRENALEESIMNDGRDFSNYSDISSFNNDIKQNKLFKNRAPVVALMGHVDHGKTSILDYILSSKIILSESGGITQKIAAYCVNTNNGPITFLDTPGHEAFINMRVRGAQLTDLVVLVVAADDGVMPQTIEAIEHIRRVNIPVIVAINKIDKYQVNVERIKNELNNYGLIPEEWGGKTQFINVSAVSGIGINDLLDAILLQSEILELKSIHSDLARAVVIDASLDASRGPVVTVLVQEGELKCGDVVLCGTEYGRIRAMKDMSGYDIAIAGPSIPVELLGLSGIPDSGDIAIVVRHERKAKEVAFNRKEKKREIKFISHESKKVDVKNVFDSIDRSVKIPELNFIVRSNTQGSIEAVCEVLKKLSTNELIIKVLSSSIGNITETDSMLALTSNAIILGFSVKIDSSARYILDLNKVNVFCYSVIYDLLDGVKKIINNKLISKNKYKVIGIAKVCSIFRSVKYGIIAGCVVNQGIIKSNKKIKIIRDKITVYEGEMESLRHFKNDVNEVKSGSECGVGVKNYSNICTGDIIEVFDLT